MSGLHINSDFTDYYDSLNDDNSIITYNRFLSDCKQRGTALKYLRSLGIKTLELKQVSQYFRDEGPIVVYTDIKAHNSNGKKIMDVADANLYNANCLASKYYDVKINIKFLQIGKRRLTLTFEKLDSMSLRPGRLIDIKESTSDYNRLVGLPIFSIDYIPINNEMVATDFNEVENLARLGINRYISSNEIVNEIINSLKIYNKI